MKIRVYQGKVNSESTVVVATTDWRRCELDAIVKFGEPQVDVGGVFAKKTPECMCASDESNDDLVKGGAALNTECFFELPENIRGIRREFPVSQSFPGNMYDDPDACAKWWSDEIVRRIIEAMHRLKFLMASEVSREEIYEV